MGETTSARFNVFFYLVFFKWEAYDKLSFWLSVGGTKNEIDQRTEQFVYTRYTKSI